MRDAYGRNITVNLIDINADEVVGVQIGTLGHKLWVCVDGQALLRIKAPKIEFTDCRPDKEAVSLNPGADCPVCEHPVTLVDQGDPYEGELGHCWCPACGWDEEREQKT